MRFEVQRQDRLTLEVREPLASMYVLSPYVWTENGRFEIALRAVNRSDNPDEKIARVYHGRGDDGLHFVMDREPILRPGPDAIDAAGCEDPSVVSNGQYRVFYSGYNPVQRETRLMLASGPSIHSLSKNGPVFPQTTPTNTKEATVIELPDRTWRLFFEYAKDDHSLIGLAMSKASTGPWLFMDFPLQPRAGRWDAWHLSPGPVVTLESGRPVMFYNGGTYEAHWRIGWLELDQGCQSILTRSEDFIVDPGPISGDASDIAFAASAIMRDERVHLYYSISDMMLMRAIIAVSP